MAIKDIQKRLGVTADGVWGNQSQTALNDSQLMFDFNKMRTNFGTLRQTQVDGVNAIVKAVNEMQTVKNPIYLAYMLATAWHETAFTMQPIAEYGKGRGRKYGTNTDIDGSKYRNLPFTYYGRGYVQLTWLTNYKKMGEKLGVDLVNNPDLALDYDIASKIMIQGMLDGSFTGVKLSTFLKRGDRQEFVKARRIINGNDKAGNIADYAVKFLDCIV